MKIGIIVPCFNVHKCIEKTILSITEQTNEDWELFIVDGGSVDGTVKIVQQFSCKDKRIKYISETDSGIYNAMNKGVRKINCDYILFMGAGDVLADTKVLENIENVLSQFLPDILYGYVYFGEKTKKAIYKRKINFLYTIRFRPISHQALFSKRTLLLDCPFNEEYKITSDQDWIMQQYKNGRSFKYIDRAICVYDLTGLSSSSDSLNDSKKEMKQILTEYFPRRVVIYKILKKIRSLFP